VFAVRERERVCDETCLGCVIKGVFAVCEKKSLRCKREREFAVCVCVCV